MNLMNCVRYNFQWKFKIRFSDAEWETFSITNKIETSLTLTPKNCVCFAARTELVALV